LIEVARRERRMEDGQAKTCAGTLLVVAGYSVGVWPDTRAYGYTDGNACPHGYTDGNACPHGYTDGNARTYDCASGSLRAHGYTDSGLEKVRSTWNRDMAAGKLRRRGSQPGSGRDR